MLRAAKTALGVMVLGSLLFSGASAFAAGAPTGGTIKVWGTPANKGAPGTVVITGAIGDYGKTVPVNAAGKVAKKAGYTKFVLTKGTILVNTMQVGATLQMVAAPPADFNAVTCSGSATFSAPIPIVSGTKAYAGITGSLTVTVDFSFFGPLTSGGKCDQGNPNPSAQFGSIVGSGTVSFS